MTMYLPNELEKYRGKDGFIHLHRTYSTLFEKTLYTTDLQYICNRITEYDLKQANLSCLEASGKVDPEIIATLRDKPKMEREVLVGKMQAADKSFVKIIRNGIRHAREMLFEANLIQDNEVVSIRNDAVFIAGRKLKHTTFGPFHFVPKNTYSLFLKLDKTTEFYYDGRHKTVTVKGISDDIVSDPDHQNGILIFLSTIFQYLVQDRCKDLKQYLIQFSEAYKRKDLPVSYYKEFNSDNIYRGVFELGDFRVFQSIASQEDLPMINGIYNYTRYVLPMIQTFL